MINKFVNAIKRDKFGRFMTRRVFEPIGLPLSIALPGVKAFKIVISLQNYLKRKNVAKKYIQNKDIPLRISPDDGYRFIKPNDIPNTDKIVEICSKLFEEKKGNRDFFIQKSNKEFLVPLLNEEDIKNHSELVDFAMSDVIIDAVIDYFGMIPTLFAVDLFYSPINSSKHSSQLFHFDSMDNRFLRFFLNISEVTDNTGPLTFIPAKLSDEVRKKLGHYDKYCCGRMQDEDVLKYSSFDDWLYNIGEPGTGVIIDTCHCMHFGSRCSGKDRLVAMFEFINYHSPLESLKTQCFIEDNKYQNDPVRSLFLEKMPISGLSFLS